MTYSARGFQLIKRGSHNCCKCLGSKGKVCKLIGQVKDEKGSKVTNNVRTKGKGVVRLGIREEEVWWWWRW